MNPRLRKAAALFAALALGIPHAGAVEIPDTFRPAWWCRGSHAQTILGALLRRGPAVPYVRERLDTPDGDFIDVDWVKGPEQAPLAVVLPGLGGSSDANYVRLLVDRLRGSGWQAAVLNARGSTGPNRLPRIEHSGNTGDLDFLVGKILERRLSARIFLAGYSAGGNKVLKWLGEKGNGVPAEVKKAAVVSAACDLAKAAANLDRGFNKKVYTKRLLDGLKGQLLRKETVVRPLIDLDKVKAADTFRVFDREATAPLDGFRDENDYWERASSAGGLGRIRVPVLMVHARNDSFLTQDDLPLGALRASPEIRLMLTSDGGHLGFVSGPRPFHPDEWLEKTVADFLREQSV